MTNEEAIKTLEANYPDACFGQLREAVDAAIEALKAQDAAGDTISRQAAVEACYNGWNKDYRGIAQDIKDLPSAQPEVLACGEGELIAQPEIIRCNDCKHWTQTTGNMRGFGLGDCDYINAKLVNCNGFCSWAERRTDG